jgi:hypothetical protein
MATVVVDAPLIYLARHWDEVRVRSVGDVWRWVLDSADDRLVVDRCVHHRPLAEPCGPCSVLDAAQVTIEGEWFTQGFAISGVAVAAPFIIGCGPSRGHRRCGAC